MSGHRFSAGLWIPWERPRVFEFFADARNLQRITPPWVHFQILTAGEIEMKQGALIDYNIRMRGVPMRWRTEIVEWNPPYSFTDVQLRGPYKLWNHRHTFTEKDGGTFMSDEVDYELPLGPLGEMAHRLFVRGDVKRIFAFRNEALGRLLAPGRNGGEYHDCHGF